MYLKRFQSANGLCVYDMEKGQVRYHQNYEEYAHRNYFYDLSSKELLPIILECFPEIAKEKAETLSKQQFIEKGLCRIEDHASKMLDVLTEGRALLTDRDVQITLTTFLQVLSLRTPAQREDLEKIYRKTTEWLSEVSIPKEQHGDYLKKILESTSENYSKTEQIRNLLDPNICFEFSCMLLGRYDWYMGTVAPESNLSLIISDNPASMIALGVNDYCFPISPKKAVIFRTKDNLAPLFVKDVPVGNEISLSQDSVLIYNILQATVVQRELYGDRISIELLRDYINQRHILDWLRSAM